MIEVKIKNIKKLQNAFRKAPKKTVSETNDAIMKSIYTIEGESKQVTPVLTGRLRASISKNIFFSSLYGSVGPKTDYAIYVHGDPDDLKSGDRPFMKWGIEASMSDINRFFQKAADNVTKFIAKKTNV